MEIFISEGSCGEFEDNTAVWTNYSLAVFVVTAEIGEIAAASDSLHERIEHHHGLAAYPIAVLVHGAAVCAGVFVPYLLAVPTVMLGRIATEKSRYFDIEFIFLCVPFFHSDVPFLNLNIMFSIISMYQRIIDSFRPNISRHKLVHIISAGKSVQRFMIVFFQKALYLRFCFSRKSFDEIQEIIIQFVFHPRDISSLFPDTAFYALNTNFSRIVQVKYRVGFFYP